MTLLTETNSFSSWLKHRNGPCIVAGPCSVESEEQILGTARELARCGTTLLRGGIWKPRTNPGSFEGVGERGLKWLKAAGAAADLPVATEVATPFHVERCIAAGIDVLWIGARTTTSPIAVQEIANALAGVDIPVMIKNPMSPELKLWIGAIERIMHAGVTKTVAIHRGFSTHIRHSYRYQPLWRIPLELRREMPTIPILCDPSHISGERRLVPEVVEEAMKLGLDGLMVESHWHPEIALSDRAQQLPPAQLAELIEAASRAFCHRDEQSLGQWEEIDEIDQDLRALMTRRMSALREVQEMQRGNSARDRAAMYAARILTALLARLTSRAKSRCTHVEACAGEPSSRLAISS